MFNGRRKNIFVLGAAVAAGGATLAAATGPAAAGTVTQTATIPVTATDWSTTADVGQFNPSLGTLQDIGFGLTGTLQGSIGVENLGPVSSTVYGGITSAVNLSAPGLGNILSVNPSVFASATLAAYDGKINFAGPSGRTFSGLSNSQSVQKTYTVGAPGPQLPIASYIGTGKVALPVTAMANAGISGPLNLAARTQAAAGAKVTVQYGTSSASAGESSGTFGSSGFLDSFGYGISAVLVGAQQTAVQTRTLSDQKGDWTRNVSFNPFNPSLGQLAGVNLTLSGDAKTNLSVQDTGPTAGFYNATQQIEFSLLGPGKRLLDSTTATGTQAGILNPFAGTDNFNHAFGTTSTDTLLALTAPVSDWFPSDPAFFSGTDPITLAAEAIGTLSADLPGSADLLSSALEGAQVTLSYTYLPSADPPLSANLATVPEPGSLALLVFSLTGLGLFGRRPRR